MMMVVAERVGPFRTGPCVQNDEGEAREALRTIGTVRCAGRLTAEAENQVNGSHGHDLRRRRSVTGPKL